MTADRSLRVVMAGGGTGGHLFPGIAVARALMDRAPGSVVTFAGTARGIEARVVPREGFELDVIRSAGLKGKSTMERVRGLAILPASAVDAWRLVSRRRPDVVIGLGGYSSGPVVLLAALRAIPTMLLEQNAVPGLANRLLARIVDAAAVAFESSLVYFGPKGFLAGNPVRPEFFAACAPAARDRPRVLVFGGSQGAHAINVAMIEAAPQLASASTVPDVTHQTGDQDLEFVRAGYAKAGLVARVEPFLFRMDREMAETDLVVCRAGASTLAELAAAGRPAILVPFPGATDDHQRRNAEVFAGAGAARLVPQTELTGARLSEEILRLTGNPGARRRMADAVRRFAYPEAATMIAGRVLALAGRTA